MILDGHRQDENEIRQKHYFFSAYLLNIIGDFLGTFSLRRISKELFLINCWSKFVLGEIEIISIITPFINN